MMPGLLSTLTLSFVESGIGKILMSTQWFCNQIPYSPLIKRWNGFFDVRLCADFLLTTHSVVTKHSAQLHVNWTSKVYLIEHLDVKGAVRVARVQIITSHQTGTDCFNIDLEHPPL